MLFRSGAVRISHHHRFGNKSRGGIWSTSAAWWTGRAGSTGAGSGDVLLRPGDGRARPGAGGPKRRNARAAGTMLAVSLGDAFLLVSLLLCSGGMMACASSAGAARPTVSLSTLRGHLTPVAFPSRLSATRIKFLINVVSHMLSHLRSCLFLKLIFMNASLLLLRCYPIWIYGFKKLSETTYKYVLPFCCCLF